MTSSSKLAPPFILTADSITVLLNGKEHTVIRSHPNFTLVKDAVKAEEWERIPELLNLKSAVESWSNGMFKIEEDTVTYMGDRLPAHLESRILSFFRESLPFEPLLKFWQRLQANPSNRATEELYRFLEYKNIPIGHDGFIYAYKAVRGDWKDIYTGKIDNSIGRVVTMPRNLVNDDPRHGCSVGLHIGSIQYVTGYGASIPDRHIVIVRVDPADIVSIPYDCSYQKIRCCKYEVVEEYKGLLPETLYEPDLYEDYDDAKEYWEEEEEDDAAWWDLNDVQSDQASWYVNTNNPI